LARTAEKRSTSRASDTPSASAGINCPRFFFGAWEKEKEKKKSI
jgi:hypothetical protein